MNTRDAVQQLLTGLIVLAAFAAVMQGALKRVRYRRAVPIVIAALITMLLCFAVLLLFLTRMVSDSGLVLYYTLFLFSIAMLAWFLYFVIAHFRQINKKILSLFLTYLLAVLFITLLSRDGTSSRIDIQMEVFSGIQEALRTHSIKSVRHMILNVALFVPLGSLFPMIHEDLASWIFVMASGMMLSTMIETIQLVGRLGICDINDILANTLGAIVGYLVFKAVRCSRR